MARQARPTRQSKKVYYFIVEGYTEKNYTNHLISVYKKKSEIYNCKGGNAKTVLEEAKDISEKHGDDYSGYIVWFDFDAYKPSTDNNLKQSLEVQRGIHIYMSKPCVENWLLAHFTEINLEETQCNRCEQKLNQYISSYDKNDPNLFKKYILLDRIEMAIKNYPELGEMVEKFLK